jgi:hypothetical protein
VADINFEGDAVPILGLPDRARDTAAFLAQVAECFDNGLAIGYETPFLDPINNQPITAGRLLERIRLGK